MDDHSNGSNMLYVEALCPFETASPSSTNHPSQSYPNILVETPKPGREGRHASWGVGMLRSEVESLAHTSGDRHRRLWLEALRVGSVVGGGDLLKHHAETELVNAGVQMGLSQHDARRQVTNGLSKGERSPRIRYRNDALLWWAPWWEHINPSDAVFAGRQGANLYKFFAGVHAIGQKVGKRDLNISVRQAAVAANMPTSTVGRMMRRGGMVEESGFLKPIRRSRPMSLNPTPKGTTWRATIPKQSVKSGTVGCVAVRATPACPTFHAWDGDVFEGRVDAWRVFGMLDIVSTTTVKELATVTGLTSQTVRHPSGVPRSTRAGGPRQQV